LSRTRVLFGWASVGLVTLVVGIALMALPAGIRWWLAVVALVGVLMAVPAAFSVPRELTPALLLSLSPVVALLFEDAAAWLVPSLASVLLVAAELNAMGWAGQGVGAEAVSRRLAQAGMLGVLGLAGAALVLALGQQTWLSGTVAVLVAAAAVSGVGSLVLSRTRRG